MIQSIDTYTKKIFFNRYSIVFWLVAIDLFFFWMNFVGIRYTSWDTHDAYFTEFIMLVDALKGGYLGFINQYIQSGSFVPVLARTWFYSIFNAPFLLLAQFINPLTAFELLLQFYAIFAAVGVYLFINHLTQDRVSSVWAACTYLIVLTFPILGQFGYLLSLALLPWMLYAFHYFQTYGVSKPAIGIFGILFGMFLTGCDPWHILIDFLIVGGYVFLYSMFIQWRVRALITSLVVIVIATAVYFMINLEGIFNLVDAYAWVNGEYRSPEPRLRSIGSQDPQLLISNVFFAFLNLIDVHLLLQFSNQTSWYAGVGIPVFAVSIFALYMLKNSIKKFVVFEVYFIVIAVFFLFYSAALDSGMYAFISHIPILNSHRWFGIGLEFAIFAVITITGLRLAQMETVQISQKFIVTYFFFLLICYFSHYLTVHNIIYLSVPLVLALFHKYVITFKNVIVFVFIVITIFYFRDTLFFGQRDQNGLGQIIASRNTEIEINHNIRFQPNSPEYVYYSPAVFADKQPSTHGYNIVGNPIAWYFKNTSATATFFTVTRNTRLQTLELSNNYNVNANEYMNSFTNEIIQNFPAATISKTGYIALPPDSQFKAVLESVKITPDSGKATVHTNNAAYLLFNVVYSPGWTVTINGTPAKLIHVNGIFMGVFLDKSGYHEVEFKYENNFLKYILFSVYFLLFTCIFILVFFFLRRRISDTIS